MLFREFGKTGWQVSVVGLGTWNIGNQWGEIDAATARATIDAALDNGVNLFDTADAYGIPPGLSEERLGHALAGRRHQARIVSKVGNYGKRSGRGVPMETADMVRLCAHASLHRLRTDYHDVLLCHEGGLEDPSVYLEGFAQLKAEGRLLCAGISTNRLDVLERFNRNGDCDVVEVEYNLLRRGPEAEFLPYCREQGIAVLVRGGVGQGVLSGRYGKDTRFEDSVRAKWHDNPDRQARFEKDIEAANRLAGELAPGPEMVRAALRFGISNDYGTFSIPGAKSPKQATVNAEAGDALLEPETLERYKRLIDGTA